MTKWLRKLGVPLTEYLDCSGEKTLGDFVVHNPDWPLRAWVGLLLESTQTPRLDSRKRAKVA